MTTHIFLADDHPIVRRGMRSLLESEPNFEVVGEADNGVQAIQDIERLKPDVAILDIVMGDLSGLELTRQITERLLPTRVIILSMYSDESYVKEAFRSGAYGYVIKHSPPLTLLTAVMEVTQGRQYLCPPLTERVIQAFIQNAESEGGEAFESLSSREREMLSLSANGFNNDEIAVKLNISLRTVEVHRSSMMKKLGLLKQHDLIQYAICHHIIKGNE